MSKRERDKKPRPVLSMEIERGVLTRLNGEAEVKVYAVLGKSASSDTRDCWPSLAKIVELTGLSRGTVCRALTKLENKKLIERDRSAGGRSRTGRGWSTGYYVAPTDDLFAPKTSSASATSTVAQAQQLTGAHEPPNSGAGDTQQSRQRSAGSGAGATQMGIECFSECLSERVTGSAAVGDAAATPVSACELDPDQQMWDELDEAGQRDLLARLIEASKPVQRPLFKRIEDGAVLIRMARAKGLLKAESAA